MGQNKPDLSDSQTRAIASAVFFREVALGVFHQITNQLTMVGSSLLLLQSLVEGGRTRPAQRQELQDLVDEALKGLADTRALLDSVRSRELLQADVAKSHPLAAHILRPAVEQIRALAARGGIRLNTSFGSEDYFVLVNPHLMREAVVAILNNAIWAIRENRSADRELFVALRPVDSRWVRVEIRDSGVGISPDVIPRIFEPFFTTRSKGTGLGLYFASAVVQQFGGALTLERSMPGKGSTFSLVLQIAQEGRTG